ncbi:MAG: hypothetical protein K8Q97_00060 [Candidatus Andersenbacteria bacterium]|nr:hypothetical protein [Candidatus Andersenbacteria bacterium]
MKKMRIIKVVIGIALIVLGASFFRIKTDEQFIKLTPTEESKYLVPMQSGVSYDQDAVIHNKIISRVGIYFLPLHPLLHHTGIITLQLKRGDTVLETASINSLYIDQTVPTQFIFDHPIASAQDETLRIHVTVSDSISTDIALRNRTFDNDFSGEEVHFSIDGVPQQYPFAYTADEVLHPALIKQVGGMIALAGLALITLPFLRKRQLLRDHLLLVAIAGLQGLSAIGSTTSMIVYGVAVLIVLTIAWWILRIVGRSRISALFGACIVACSTWLPLALVAAHGAVAQLSFKDALLDPNQIKISHAAGAYVGFFALFFAVVGIAVLVTALFRDTRRRMMVDSIVAIALVICAFLAFGHGAFAIPFATIPVSWGIAWFASLGLHNMQRFIGKNDRMVQIFLILLVAIALLDLMHVASVTLAYGAPL